MKWIQVKDGTKFKLNVDLYTINADRAKEFEYQLITKVELDTVASCYKKGTIFVFNADQWILESDHGAIGLDETTEVDPTVYIMV